MGAPPFHWEFTMKIELVHPAIEIVTANTLAPRLSDLRGRRVALLDNSHQNVDRVLQRVSEELSDRFDADSIPFRKPSANAPAGEILLDKVAAADAVINGVAD